MEFTPRMIMVWLGAAGALSAAQSKEFRVTVPAADADRAAYVVSFPVPADAPKPVVLKAGSGADVPVQVAPDGTAVFVVPHQRAGESLTYMLVRGDSARAGSGVEVKSDKGRLRVSVAGAPAFDYQMDKEALPRPDIRPEFKRAGYLHPVFTPSGKIVSDDYPAQHVHHHGIWAPWTKTTFQGRTPDFWNMGQKTGTVELVAVDWTWGGPVHGGFVARHRFVDLSAPQPVTALHEVWQVTAYQVAGARVFDLLLTQVCATSDPLVLPQYHYGGLGYRGPGAWYGKDKADFLTSDGERDRVKANAQRMRWVHVHGAVEGGTAGVAILGHPANFRAPQPVRVHPTEPYVSFTPSQAGEWRIQPGQPYVARYRFVAADGPPDRAQLDAYWHGFAASSLVKVEPLP